MLHIRSHYFRNANFSSLKTFKVHTSYAVQYFVPAYLLFSKTSRFIASFLKKNDTIPSAGNSFSSRSLCPMVEVNGIEPMTYSLQSYRSPN